MAARGLQQWLQWQQQLHPVAIDLGLERIVPVANRLRVGTSPAARIVVAGTNGKGSCVAFLHRIYQRAGLRVGVYTSPHLLRYNERIVRLGEPATDGEICAAFEQVEAQRQDVSLTYFEYGTLAALCVFAAHALDVEILEVGLGGRLDAVNLVNADATVIMPVSVDHEAWLGTDRESIGAEKAPVMRTGRPVILAESAPPATVLAYAAAHDVPVTLAGRDYRWRRTDAGWCWLGADAAHYSLPPPGLPGPHQYANAAAAIAVVQALQARLPADAGSIAAGVAGAALPGRATRVAGEVETILDVAHNPAGARALAALLQDDPPPGSTHVILGMMRDKSHAGVVSELLSVTENRGVWHVAALADERAAGAAVLGECLRRLGAAPVTEHASVPDAYAGCLASSRPGDRIVICGSFVTVADAFRSIPALAAATGNAHA